MATANVVNNPEAVVASDGVGLPMSSLAQTMTYSGTALATISVTFNGNVYIQTYSYTSGNLTGISRFIKQ